MPTHTCAAKHLCAEARDRPLPLKEDDGDILIEPKYKCEHCDGPMHGGQCGIVFSSWEVRRIATQMKRMHPDWSTKFNNNSLCCNFCAVTMDGDVSATVSISLSSGTTETAPAHCPTNIPNPLLARSTTDFSLMNHILGVPESPDDEIPTTTNPTASTSGGVADDPSSCQPRAKDINEVSRLMEQEFFIGRIFNDLKHL